MPRSEIELNPVTHITTNSIGKPGQRVFYIQGWQDNRVVTILVEKVQVQTLAIGVEQFLKEIDERYTDLAPAAGDYDESLMHIQPPVDPMFRTGEIGLAYDPERDLACLIAHEILSDQVDEENAGEVRMWCTRSQLLAMSNWGLEVTKHGRPICPQCGEPMDPEGHFCPKKNGHKH